MATPSLLIYLILGTSGSGRRAILADLMESGLGAEARPVLATAAGERPAEADLRERLGRIAGLSATTWTRSEGGAVVTAVPAEATHVFFLADGTANPVDQVEAFHAWLANSGGELARIITVVNCQLGHAQPPLLQWYDACVHFSDVVLLNRRDGVPNKWVSDFVGRFRKQHLPCLVEFVKQDAVANPALILEPEARRLSLLFDPVEPWADTGDEDEDEGGEEAGEETLSASTAERDPYLERLASGRRARELPDIAKYLGG